MPRLIVPQPRLGDVEVGVMDSYRGAISVSLGHDGNVFGAMQYDTKAE
jgi:hypothetical protein